MILAATTVAFASLAVDGGVVLGGAQRLPASSKLVAFALAVALVPLVAIWLIKRQRIGRLNRLLETEGVRSPGIGPLLVCFVLYAANFVVLGAILQLMTSVMTEAGESHFWFLTGIFATAWVAGYLTPGAPAGLGVREAILVTLLDPVFGPAVAVALPLGLRIVTSAGDAIGFIAGLMLRRAIA